MTLCMLCLWHLGVVVFFFVKQKTAYERRISDWSSDVCSSDLIERSYDTGHISYDPANHQKMTDARAAKIAGIARDIPLQAVDQGPERGRLAVVGWGRSEERRGGKECVRTSRSRWSAYH